MYVKKMLVAAIGLTLLALLPAACATAGEPAIEVSSFRYYTEFTGIPPVEPEYMMVLKNISDEPVVSLKAEVTLLSNEKSNWDFGVSPSTPLLPENSVSERHFLLPFLLGDSSQSYHLTISGKFQDGHQFTQQQEVKITYR